MPTIRDCAARVRGEWIRPHWLRSRKFLASWSRKARPFLLTAAVVGTTVIAAGNTANDRLRAPVAPPLQPSPKAAEPTSMPWTVEVPTLPEPGPEVSWTRPDFRDPPELVAAPPGHQRSSAGGQHTSHGDAAVLGGDPATWLLIVALPLTAVAAVVVRRKLGRVEPDDPADVGLALLEPEQLPASETETEVSADLRPPDNGGEPAVSGAVRPAAATDLTPTAAASAAPAAPVAPPAPVADTQAEPPPSGDGEAPPEPSARSSDGRTRREHAASRVVLFERRSGTPWGR